MISAHHRLIESLVTLVLFLWSQQYMRAHEPSVVWQQGSNPMVGSQPAVVPLSDEECWSKMPAAVRGSGQPLPVWAKAVAVHMPRTAAAMLVLDFTHRTRSPLDSKLRAKCRWVIARENRCEYSQLDALADLKRAGASDAEIAILQGPADQWPADEREPLEFVRLLTVAAPTISDERFRALQKTFGDRKVAAMILLAAYGNFQDRILLGLNLPLEPQGAMAPLDVQFVEDAFQLAALTPDVSQPFESSNDAIDVIEDDETWTELSYDELQSRLEQQRARTPRLPIPTWDEVKELLPPAMAARPTLPNFRSLGPFAPGPCGRSYRVIESLKRVCSGSKHAPFSATTAWAIARCCWKSQECHRKKSLIALADFRATIGRRFQKQNSEPTPTHGS